MEEINDLKKKINHLEYEEIKGLKEDISKITLDLNTNNILTQQSVEVTKKLDETMNSVKDAMIDISTKLGETERTNQELKTNVQHLNSKFERLETKVEENEDSKKIDVVVWLKKNFISVIMSVGILGYILSQME